MKKIFLLLLAALPILAVAQTPLPFVIKSKVGNFNAPAKAYLVYSLGANRVIDSTAIINGSFDFSGNIMSPTSAFMVIDHKGVGFAKLDSTADVLSLLIDKGEFSISGKDSVSKATIIGSPINDDNKKLTSQLQVVNENAKKLQNEVRNTSRATQNTPEFQNSMQAKYKALQLQQKTVLKTFILANPGSYMSLMALNAVGGPSPDPSELDPLYNALSPALKETEAAKVFKANLEAIRATAIGVMAPDFTQADVNGIPVKLSAYRGKYVLIDFWASWCGPCRQENPNVVKTYAKYKTKNFTIIGVSLDKAGARSAWLSAIKNDGLTWTQVSDLKFWNNEVAKLYSVASIPSNFLIDPNGKIIARDLRGSDLDNKLAEIFGRM